MPDQVTSNQLFAFWKYHDGRCHTFLGSPVKAMNPDGRVVTQGYGGGLTVSPVLLLPLASGEQRLREIEKIDAELAVEITRITVAAHVQRCALLGVTP